MPVASTGRPLAAWTPAAVQCLVFTLMSPSSAAQKGTSFDPLPLMQALQQTDAPILHDVGIKALIAVRYLQSGMYPETLALLMDLSDIDDAFGLTYDVVQRVYSMRQRGDGAVALQGL